MQVLNADVPPTIEHGGTCFSYFMIDKGSFRKETEGGFLEFIGEFELKPGSRLEPHRHDSHEFYYLLSGRAVMTIEAESQEVGPGDLVHIPRNAVHSIRPAVEGESFSALAFAVSFEPEGATYTDAPLPTEAAAG
jgi:quercetin dioxygenase-like cupin family protein